MRKKQRQGPNKSEGDVHDMIGVMHEMSLVTLFTPPLFATVSSNFPSVELNNLDASTMWHDIINLKKELELLKQVQTEKNDYVDDLKSELKEVKALLQVSIPIFQNSMHVSPQPKPAKRSFADIAKQPAINDKVLPPKLGRSGRPISSQVPVHRYDVQEQILKKNDFVWNEKTKRRKPVKQPSIGKKATNDIKTVNVKPPAKIFLSRLQAETTLEQVKVFVKQQFKAEAVDVLKLSAQLPESYSSFRIPVSGVAIKDALNMEYWPEGALAKKIFFAQ